MLLGVNVAVVVLAALLSVLKTVPETALLELSTKVKVLLVTVELSINSLKVAEMLETTVVAPSDGEVEETVGAVVSVVVVVVSVAQKLLQYFWSPFLHLWLSFVHRCSRTLLE